MIAAESAPQSLSVLGDDEAHKWPIPQGVLFISASSLGLWLMIGMLIKSLLA